MKKIKGKEVKPMALELGPHLRQKHCWLKAQEYSNTHTYNVANYDVLLRIPKTKTEKQQLISQLGEDDWNPYVDSEGNLIDEVFFSRHNQEGYDFVFIMVNPVGRPYVTIDEKAFVKGVLEDQIDMFFDK